MSVALSEVPLAMKSEGNALATTLMDVDKNQVTGRVQVYWMRSVFWNLTVTGLVAFLAPGLYNACTGLLDAFSEVSH